MVIEVVESRLYSKIEQSGVIIVHYATEWCIICDLQNDILDELSDSIKHIRFYKVNTENTDLIDKHSLLTLPAVLIYKNGKLIRTLGLTGKNTLIEIIDNI
jgi:thiol-disulfide isomerase/thioredoxin